MCVVNQSPLNLLHNGAKDCLNLQYNLYAHLISQDRSGIYLPKCRVDLSSNWTVTVDFSYFKIGESQQSPSSWNSSQVSTWTDKFLLLDFSKGFEKYLLKSYLQEN